MLERIGNIYKTNFAKKVSTLFGANVASHCISLLNLFIIARIFTLEDIGAFQVLMSYVTIVGTYSLLSYHIAIQTSSDDDLPYLVYGSIFIALGTAIITIFGLWIINYQLYLIVGVLMTLSSFILIIDSVNIRDQEAYKIGFRKIFQQLFQTSFLISCYLEILTPTLDNLIITTLFAGLFSNLVFSAKILPLITSVYNKANIVFQKMKAEFKGSGTLSASDFLNSAAYNLPIIIIERFFGQVYAAFYSTILRICNVPISLIADSISKVYLGSISAEARGNKTRKISRQNFRKLNLFMVISAILGLVIIILFLPTVVTIVLGERWAEAAIIGQILAPLFCLGYLTTPLSMVMYVFKKQTDVLKFQINYFIISIISFVIGVLFDDIYIAFILFSFLSTLRYLFIYYKITFYTNRNSF